MNIWIQRFFRRPSSKTIEENLPRWQWDHLSLASHTRALLEYIGCDCVFDVGAHEGQYGCFLRNHVGYTGPIFSFEPARDLFDNLSEKARADQQWKVFPCALGSARGISTIHIIRGNSPRSTLSPNPSDFQHHDAAGLETETETVPVRTVDDILEQEGVPPFSSVFLKMDTRGCDGEVLKGVTSSLPRIAALQSEVSCIPTYRNMNLWLASIEGFENKGFSVRGMFMVARNQDLQVVEFDWLGINNFRSSISSVHPETPQTGYQNNRAKKKQSEG